MNSEPANDNRPPPIHVSFHRGEGIREKCLDIHANGKKIGTIRYVPNAARQHTLELDNVYFKRDGTATLEYTGRELNRLAFLTRRQAQEAVGDAIKDIYREQGKLPESS